MTSVTAAYAKANLPTLLKRVKNGERITISHYNKPVADLVPSAAGERPVPKLGTGKHLAAKIIVDPNWADALTDVELNEWLS